MNDYSKAVKKLRGGLPEALRLSKEAPKPTPIGNDNMTRLLIEIDLHDAHGNRMSDESVAGLLFGLAGKIRKSGLQDTHIRDMHYNIVGCMFQHDKEVSLTEPKPDLFGSYRLDSATERV
jgi:hypothetical protein